MFSGPIPTVLTSDVFFAEASVKSSRKLFIFVIYTIFSGSKYQNSVDSISKKASLVLIVVTRGSCTGFGVR